MKSCNYAKEKKSLRKTAVQYKFIEIYERSNPPITLTKSLKLCVFLFSQVYVFVCVKNFAWKTTIIFHDRNAFDVLTA